jgi:hypothetical protein
MKVREVTIDNRKRQLELTTAGPRHYPFPYSRMDPSPRPDDPIAEVYVDPELGNEAVTYILASGAEGAVHIDHALDYNADPNYLHEMLLHRLTGEALERIDDCGLSRREIARRLGTSPAQLYRLLDPANKRKSMNKTIALLRVLGCDVDVVVKDGSARR